MRSKVSALVVTVRTTSTSFICGTGLKKCRPTMRSARAVAAAIAAMVRLDVFDAKIVWDGQIASSSRQSAFFTSRSSTTASITMSHADRSATRVVTVSRPSAASRACAVSLPFSIARAQLFSMLVRARAARGSSTSRRTVSKPHCAATWAMPLPMSPPPRTPIVLMLDMSVG